MKDKQKAVAERCFEAAETNALKFPAIVAELINAGFERYTVDYARAEQTYYLPDGESIRFHTRLGGRPIGKDFDVAAIKAAILEAQQDAPGYSYEAFCEKVMHAGCVGYVVSFLGKRAVYSGRTGETHVELFPE